MSRRGGEQVSSCGLVPVPGHRQVLQQWKPAGGEGLQGGDAVVVQVQLSEEHLVAQPGRLEAGGQT